MAGFFFFENFPIGGIISILETISLTGSTIILQNKTWCQMFNPMCTALQMWHNLIFQIQVCFQRLIRLSKISCIFVKISTSRNWHPYSISAMFYGNLSSSYETLARKSRPSIAFDWNYFLQTATIRRTTEPQRRCVVGTSVAGMKAAAIGRIFDIPKGSKRYLRQEGPKGRTPRASKNVPLSLSILPVFSDDISAETLPSWYCGSFPIIVNCHWSRSRAIMTAWWNFNAVLHTQAVPHLDNHPLQDKPCSCTMGPYTSHTANTKDLLRPAPWKAWIAWSSRNSDLNLIEKM